MTTTVTTTVTKQIPKMLVILQGDLRGNNVILQYFPLVPKLDPKCIRAIVGFVYFYAKSSKCSEDNFHLSNMANSLGTLLKGGQ